MCKRKYALGPNSNYSSETKITKLVDKQSTIFNDVSICVLGLTNPNAPKLKTFITQHGGIYNSYQMKTTTHIIASNIRNNQLKNLKHIPIVTPSWITDSVTAGKLLNYRKYVLIAKESSISSKLEFSGSQKCTINDENCDSTSDGSEHSSYSDREDSISKLSSDYLSDFFKHSRLHIIASLGTEYKQRITNLRNRNNGTFYGREHLLQNKGKDFNGQSYSSVIMHVDMDCFFVSVSLRNRPNLKCKLVAVTHGRNGQLSPNGPGRTNAAVSNPEYLPDADATVQETIDSHSSMSEIASCSYEARKYGVVDGMYLGTAMKLCPNLVILPYDFQGYKEVSSILYDVITSYTLDIEVIGCDEMYVDVTQILNAGLSVHDWAAHIRNEIMDKTGCPCSTGFGSNKLQAKLATKKAKPNGHFYLEPEKVQCFMAEIPLANLPGVGDATLCKLKNLGVKTCGDLQVSSINILQSELGRKNGETLMEQAKGIDRKPLNYIHERKSVSAEINYGIRFDNLESCHTLLSSLAREVWHRLMDIEMTARCLTLKLMVRAQDAPTETAKYNGHGICDNLSKSITFSSPMNDDNIIFKEAKSLLEKLKVTYNDIRGLGIQLSKLGKRGPVNNILSQFLNRSICDDSQGRIANSPSKICNNPIDQNKPDKPKNSNGSTTPRAMKSPIKMMFNANKKVNNTKSKMAKSKLKFPPVNLYFKNINERNAQLNKVPAKTYKIDMEVLNALPVELRNEIIKENSLHDELIAIQVKRNAIVDADGATDKSDSGQTGNMKENERSSPFGNFTWEQIKSMIKQWIAAESEPSDIDVQMIATYYQQLAVERNIEQLRIAFNFLYRTLTVMSCKWHKAYFTIMDKTQKEILVSYGSTLMVPRQFECCHV